MNEGIKKIAIVLLLLILITGCVNKSEEACSMFKHLSTDNNTLYYYEMGNCIVEDQNYDNVLILQCGNYEYINLIVKYNYDNWTTESIQTLNNLKEKCTIIEEMKVEK